MSDAAELRAIREEIAALAAKIEPKRRKAREHRQQVIVRVLPSEIPIIDAAAEQRGQCRSEWIRDAIGAALGNALAPKRELPPGLAAHNRRKAARFDDGKSNLREMDRAQLAQEARRGIIASRMTRALDRGDDAATVARYADTMMAETTAVLIVPKLPKAGG